MANPWALVVPVLMGLNSEFFLRSTVRQRLLPGVCKPVPGTEIGSEDIYTLPNGLAFISSGLRPPQGKNGKILLFDFNKPNQGATEMKISGNFDKATFVPHGLDVWRDGQTGVTYLFVVNHHPQGDRVERFRFAAKTKTLVHEETFIQPSFFSVNDVAAVGKRQFYFTDIFSPRSAFRPTTAATATILYLLRLVNIGHVGFLDGSKLTILVKDIVHPNGVTLSRDKRYLFVSGWAEKEMVVYRRISDTYLKRSSVVHLDNFPDNLYEEPNGDVWLAGQLSFEQINRQVFIDTSIQTSSQVIRLRKDKNGKYQTEEILADDGLLVNGASVANRYKNRLLVGEVYGKAKLCNLSQMNKKDGYY